MDAEIATSSHNEQSGEEISPCSIDCHHLCGSCSLLSSDKVEHSRFGKVARVIFSHEGHGEESDGSCYWRYVDRVHRYRHPNVVSVFGTDGQTAATGLFSEYPDGGDVLHYTKRHGLGWSDLLRVTGDILKGLAFIEWASCDMTGAIHILLRPDNVWMFSPGTAKIAFCGFPCQNTRGGELQDERLTNRIHSIISFGSTLSTMVKAVEASLSQDTTRGSPSACPHILQQMIDLCSQSASDTAPSFHDLLQEMRNHSPPPFYTAWDVTLHNRITKWVVSSHRSPLSYTAWDVTLHDREVYKRARWVVSKKEVYGPRLQSSIFESKSSDPNHITELTRPTDNIGDIEQCAFQKLLSGLVGDGAKSYGSQNDLILSLVDDDSKIFENNKNYLNSPDSPDFIEKQNTINQTLSCGRVTVADTCLPPCAVPDVGILLKTKALKEACLSDSDSGEEMCDTERRSISPYGGILDVEEPPSLDLGIEDKLCAPTDRSLDEGYCYQNAECGDDSGHCFEDCDPVGKWRPEVEEDGSCDSGECDESESDSLDNYNEHYDMQRICDDNFLNDLDLGRKVDISTVYRFGRRSKVEVDEYGRLTSQEPETVQGIRHLGYGSSENGDDTSDCSQSIADCGCGNSVDGDVPSGDRLASSINRETETYTGEENWNREKEDEDLYSSTSCENPDPGCIRNHVSTLARQRLGEFRDMPQTDILKDKRTDILILLKDLDSLHAQDCLSEHSCLKDFRSCALRNLEKIEKGDTGKDHSPAQEDPNMKPFPVPRQVRVDPSSLRPWMDTWQPLDTSLPDSGYAWDPPLVCGNLSPGTEDFPPWYGDSEPFDTSIDGEVAWNTLPADVVADDQPTEQQLKIITHRQARPHFRDETCMSRRRQRLAEYFQSNYNIADDAMSSYLGFACRLVEDEKTLEELVEMDFCFIIK